MTTLLYKNAYKQVVSPTNEDIILDAVIRLFESKPIVNETDFKILGKQLGVSDEIIEQNAFNLLSSFLHAGRYKGSNKEINENELAMGIEVEYEHTTNSYIARRIALDHLAELPDYYTQLAIMENK